MGYRSIKELLFRAIPWQMRENVCACEKKTKNAVVFSVIICSLKCVKLDNSLRSFTYPCTFGDWNEIEEQFVTAKSLYNIA